MSTSLAYVSGATILPIFAQTTALKPYLLLIFIILTPLLSTAQTDQAELKGVITFRAQNGSKHADAGAEVIVYLIDTVKSLTNKYDRQRGEDSTINNSFLATLYFEEYQTSPITKTQREMVRKLKALQAWPEEKLHDLDNAATAIIGARVAKEAGRTNADNNGNYSLKLPPGYYGILFRSRHLRSDSKAEAHGNIMLDNADLKPGGVVTKNEEML